MKKKVKNNELNSKVYIHYHTYYLIMDQVKRSEMKSTNNEKDFTLQRNPIVSLLFSV